MSQLTKKAIVETTITLAQKRPLNKITVRDIVEECGITRNTFYYHFHDVFEVLEYAVKERLGAMQALRSTDPEGALLELFTFCISHKRMFVNLYRAMGHDHFSDYFIGQFHSILENYLAEETADAPIESRDLQMICIICEETLLGLFLRWLKDDQALPHQEELEHAVTDFYAIFEGHIHFALENCRRNS